ncbi:hypothetical protein [Archangium violaceum]|uniref:hypothetical protein n=1 Tax=Archangium violaceum TaxID=83451 RepID=UPI0036D8973D
MASQVVVISNATAQVVGAGGMGFRLEPLTNQVTGNGVRMSVTIRLNRSDATVVTLRDDAPRYFAGPFEVLEILGGALGDRWLVTVFEAVGEGVGAPARVAAPEPLLLRKQGAWPAAESLPAVGYFLAGLNGRTAAGPDVATPPLDVSGWTHLSLSVKASLGKDPGQPTSNPRLRVIIQELDGPEATANEVWRFEFPDLPNGGFYRLDIGPGLALPPEWNPDTDGANVELRRLTYVRVYYAITETLPSFRPSSTSTISLRGAR